MTHFQCKPPHKEPIPRCTVNVHTPSPISTFRHFTPVFLSHLAVDVYILTTELRSGQMESGEKQKNICGVVEARLLLCRFTINHSSWQNADQGSVVIGNLIQMLLGNEPRCGRKWTSTRTINSILLSKQSLLKDRETPHLWKVELPCVYAHLAPSTMWTTHRAWCWTSWRRSASVCWQWQEWDRHWCGVSTRRRSDRSWRDWLSKYLYGHLKGWLNEWILFFFSLFFLNFGYLLYI